eukprot:6374364-Prymnesium_polylepis.1
MESVPQPRVVRPRRRPAARLRARLRAAAACVSTACHRVVDVPPRLQTGCTPVALRIGHRTCLVASSFRLLPQPGRPSFWGKGVASIREAIEFTVVRIHEPERCQHTRRPAVVRVVAAEQARRVEHVEAMSCHRRCRLRGEPATPERLA